MSTDRVKVQVTVKMEATPAMSSLDNLSTSEIKEIFNTAFEGLRFLTLTERIDIYGKSRKQVKIEANVILETTEYALGRLSEEDFVEENIVNELDMFICNDDKTLKLLKGEGLELFLDSVSDFRKLD